MHVFHIRYRDTQGTLMRILNAATRRGIDMPYVLAQPADCEHRVTLLLEVSSKQVGQLSRDWYAIVDVLDVHTGITVLDAVEFVRAQSLPAPAPTPSVLGGEPATQQASA